MAAVSSVVGKQHESTSKRVLNLVFSMPIGIVRHHLKRAGAFREGEGERYYVAVCNLPAFEYLFRKANQEDRDVVEDGIGRVYANSAYNIERLHKDAAKPFSLKVSLVDIEGLLGMKGGARYFRSLLERNGSDFILEEKIACFRSVRVHAVEEFERALMEALDGAGARYADLAINETKIFENE